jgi:hypothetical protein
MGMDDKQVYENVLTNGQKNINQNLNENWVC